MTRHSLSPEHYSTLNATADAHYIEVASSREPYPVARILDQIASLHDELDQERQRRTGERRELEEQSQIELDHLQKTRDGLEGKLAQLRNQYRTDLDRLSKQTAGMQDN